METAMGTYLYREHSAWLQDLAIVYHWTDGGILRKVLTCYRTPGLHAITVFRFGHWLRNRRLLLRLLLEPIYLLWHHRIRTKWGIEIGRDADIGPGFYIGHYGGITINGRAVIGANVAISQQVTIGISGTGEHEGVPKIGSRTYIGPGAKLYGKITVGKNCKIGPNAVIYRDIPDNAVVVDKGFTILSYEGNL